MDKTTLAGGTLSLYLVLQTLNLFFGAIRPLACLPQVELPALRQEDSVLKKEAEEGGDGGQVLGKCCLPPLKLPKGPPR